MNDASIKTITARRRMTWTIAEVLAKWFERKQGGSRFQVLKWVPAYLRWHLYAFATTFLRLPANSVKQRSAWKTAK